MPNIGKDDHPKLWSLIFVLIIALTFLLLRHGPKDSTVEPASSWQAKVTVRALPAYLHSSSPLPPR